MKGILIMNDHKMVFPKIQSVVVILTLFIISFYNSASENNLQFDGALVSEPCNLDPNTTDIVVDFKSIVAKSLYKYNRSSSEVFTINLTDCDTSMSNMVSFTFKGAEDQALPGLLAVNGTAKGIAIGLEYEDGTMLSLNQPTTQQALSDGVSQFTFRAYVAGEPEAVQKESMIMGQFNATATFEMEYQ